MNCRILALALIVVVGSAGAQLKSLSDSEAESVPGSPEQQKQLAQARQYFAAEQWPAAFSAFTDLHTEIPRNIKVSEYLAEAALNVGKPDVAIALMEPVRRTSPARWQASALLARAFAETDRNKERDAELDHLKQMHDTKFAPKIAALQMILLERRVTETGSVRIWYSLQPWGKFNTYLFARVYDAQGVETYHVALDSSDVDQALWAKSHATEAAAGERVFFLDGYSRPQAGANGTTTNMQALLEIYNGKPEYDLVRDRIVGIAAKKVTPMATASKP